MKKLVLMLLALLAVPAFGQMTNVVAVITGSNGTPYANGTYSIHMVSSTGQDLTSSLIYFGSVPIQVLASNGGLDSFGGMNVNLISNTLVTSPVGTQWQFGICSQTPTPGSQIPPQRCFTGIFTITGSSQDLTSALSALAPPIGGGGGGNVDVENNLVAVGTPSNGVVGVPAINQEVNQNAGYIVNLGSVSPTFGVEVVGDSISTGVGVIPLTLSFSQQVATNLGLPQALNTSAEQSGADACDLAYLFAHNYVTVDNNSPVIATEFGTNDANGYDIATGNKTSFKQCSDAVYTWGSLPPASRLFTSPTQLVSAKVGYNTGTSGAVTTGIITISIPNLPNYVSTGYQYALSGATTMTALNGQTLQTYRVASDNIAISGNNQIVFNSTCTSCASQLPTYTVTAVNTAVNGAANYAGTLTGGAGNAFFNVIVNVAGFATTANNGSFLCTFSSSTIATCNNPNAVAETHAATLQPQTIPETVTLTPTNWTETGTWGVDNTTFPLFAVATDSTANDTISTNLQIGANGVVILRYLGYPSGTSTLNAAINGVVATDTITNSSTLVSNPGANAPVVFPSVAVPIVAIFKNQTPGPGTVVVKNLAGGLIGVVDIGSPLGTQGGSTAPAVYSLGVQKQQGDLRSAQTAQYDLWALQNITELNTLGLRDKPCNLRNYTNPDTSAQGGTYFATDLAPLHPGPNGATQFARALNDCMQVPQIAINAQIGTYTNALAGQALDVSAPATVYSRGGPVRIHAAQGNGLVTVFNSGISGAIVNIAATNNSAGNLALNVGCGVTYSVLGGQIFQVGKTCPQMTWANLLVNRVTQSGGTFALSCSAISPTYLFTDNTPPSVTLDASCAVQGDTFFLKNGSATTNQTISGAVYGDATGTITLAPLAAILLQSYTYAGVGGYFIMARYPPGGSGSFTAGGDLSGTSSSQQVVGIQNNAVPTPSSGYLHFNGTAFVWDTPSGGGLSGMTAGQVPVAATASTVTSSIPIAGAGPALTTGPNSGVTAGDLALFTGTAGQITDGAIAGSNVATLSGTQTFTGLKTFSAGINLPSTTAPLQFAGSAGSSGQCAISGGTGATPSWGSCATGSSGISGQAAGVIPLGSTATTIAAQSHIDDGNTTAATITSTEPVVAPSFATNGSANGTLQLTATGTPPGAAPTNTVQIEAPNSVTAYRLQVPGAVATAGNTFLSCTAASPSVCTWAAGSGGDTITSPNSTLTVGGTSSATTLDFNLAHSNIWTAFQTYAVTAAASTPQVLISTACFSGGTATTNFPCFMYQPTGATAASSWSVGVGGTIIGANAQSGFTGNFLDFHINGGASLFAVSSAGTVTTLGGVLLGGGFALHWTGKSQFNSPSDGIITALNNGSSGFTRLNLGGTTSSFPALQVNGTGLQAELADGSAQTGFSAATYATATNCAGVGTSASPSIVTCAAASAGAFSCAITASAATCTVNTTAVTANSEIIVTEVASESTRLGVTCNTTPSSVPLILLASKVAATSFTINMPSITTNPACFVFHVVN